MHENGEFGGEGPEDPEFFAWLEHLNEQIREFIKPAAEEVSNSPESVFKLEDLLAGVLDIFADMRREGLGRLDIEAISAEFRQAFSEAVRRLSANVNGEMLQDVDEQAVDLLSGLGSLLNRTLELASPENTKTAIVVLWSSSSHDNVVRTVAEENGLAEDRRRSLAEMFVVAAAVLIELGLGFLLHGIADADWQAAMANATAFVTLAAAIAWRFLDKT